MDVERYQLHDLVTLAKGKLAASQKLVALLEGLVKENTTLGETFWTEELRAKLTDQLATEYDTVIRQELRFTDKLNEHLEPAPIRLHDEWDGRAPYERSRRMSPQELAVVREQLAELLELGMIQPSASPFGAAVMVIPKPGQPGKFRMVIDYRRLNSLTVPDKYPLPDIGELLDDIGSKGYRYWCTFDLCSGFYNVPILPEHVERTAMSTPLGNYQWRVMPMGLRNAPSIFQRNMQRVFSDMPQVRIFVDDGIIGGGHSGRVVCESAQGAEEIERYRHGDKEIEVAILQGRAEISGTCDIQRRSVSAVRKGGGSEKLAATQDEEGSARVPGASGLLHGVHL